MHLVLEFYTASFYEHLYECKRFLDAVPGHFWSFYVTILQFI